MTRNAASTSRHAAGDPESVGSRSAAEEAARLATQAEEILGGYLEPGAWPASRAARRFLAGGDLERVLSLYMQAMESDPLEPAYPWNLASSLDRLRLPDLALVFIRRAIRVAREAGDLEWAGVDAHLALADIAMRAGESEAARMAIERARGIDPDAPVERYLRRLRREPPTPERRELARRATRSALPKQILEELAVLERTEAGAR
jgi:tetratricopeptide (TPR) repeat protein